jgi:hypothetical protein
LYRNVSSALPDTLRFVLAAPAIQARYGGAVS